VIDALNRIIGITVPPIPLVWQEGGTIVVGAHGTIGHEADVVDYRDMVTIVRDRIQDLLKKGQTLAQIRQADPVKGLPPPLWRRYRAVDHQSVHRGGLQEPRRQVVQTLGRVLRAGVVLGIAAVRFRPSPRRGAAPRLRPGGPAAPAPPPTGKPARRSISPARGCR
jgi:hypothetical protein